MRFCFRRLPFLAALAALLTLGLTGSCYGVNFRNHHFVTDECVIHDQGSIMGIPVDTTSVGKVASPIHVRSIILDGYYLFNKAVVKQIRNAEDGSTVTVDCTGWASFMRMVFEALAEHPSVTLVVKYGNNKELTIPAGTDILSAIGNAQDVLFTKLAKLV